MQVLHWLFRASHAKGIDQTTSSPSPSTQKGKEVNGTKEADQPTKDIQVFKKNKTGRGNKSDSKRSKVSYKKCLKVFLLGRKDIASACFCSTINLKSPRSDLNTRRSSSQRHYWIENSMKMMKKEDIISKAPLAISKSSDQASSHASNNNNNQVLPISETLTTVSKSTSPNDNDQTSSTNGSMEVKKEKGKVDKTKMTMSRMKELLRWAAAAKSEKGGRFISRKVLQFRNKGNPKANNDDQFSYESPKISFKWDVESCSTTSSVYSAISVTSLKNNPNLSMLSLSSAQYNNNIHSPTRKGNWITTDTEFVVLEL